MRLEYFQMIDRFVEVKPDERENQGALQGADGKPRVRGTLSRASR